MTAGIIDYKYKKEKQGVDLETLFVTALTAFTGGIGIIAVFAVLTGADINGVKREWLVLICCLVH